MIGEAVGTGFGKLGALYRPEIAGGGAPVFTVLDSAGTEFICPLTVLDASGTEYTVLTTVLDSAGTAYEVAA